MTWKALPEGPGANPQNRRIKAIDSDVRGSINAVNGFILPVKTTTGDPTGVDDGYTYVNTIDKKIRTYASSAWRDLATW